MRKSVWLLSAALVTIASPAIGQDTTQPDPGKAEPATGATAAAQTQPTPPAQPDEIVITAQGRRQLLQNVPISVTAVGGQQMQLSGATDIRQLNQLAPSLLVSSTSTEANGSARIRGIGTVGDNPGLESSVAVFVDGVYRSRSGIGLNELGEIDRIEVLRGPQGTLFGRNASAGLIHIFSKKPQFNWNAFGEVTIGNFNMRRLEAGITGPIADNVAFRLEGVWLKRDGFYRMLFCAGTPTERYRLAYAESPDGINWTRKDDAMSVVGPREYWDSEMQAYPCTVMYRDKVYLLYNGNNYGEDGFGYAVLEHW